MAVTTNIIGSTSTPHTASKYVPVSISEDTLLLQNPAGPSFLLPKQDVMLINEMLKSTSRRQTLLNYIIKNVTPDSHFLDIGAGFGFYCCSLAAKQPERTGKIIALEPVGIARRYLNDNLELNHVSHCVHVEIEIARHTMGAVDFYEYRKSLSLGSCLLPKQEPTFNGDTIKRVSVESVRPDQIMPDTKSVSLIKIDVNGNELSALQGCENIIRENLNTKILLRWSPDLLDESDYGRIGLYNYARRLGFKFKVLETGGALRNTDPMEYNFRADFVLDRN